MNNSSKVLVGLLAGFAAGTAFGMLVAPGEGRENRESLRNSIKALSFSLPESAITELYRFSKWKKRLLALVKAQIIGPEPEMPDDLEHGCLIAFNTGLN